MFYPFAEILLQINFCIYLLCFATALSKNFNFNIILVGLIYLAPLVPWGLIPGTEGRFLAVSFMNTIFGILELAIFVITVRPTDITFDTPFMKQLWGHTLPIALALIGLSYFARMQVVPVGHLELALILVLFIGGSVFRAVAVYQIGTEAFKFDIAFRDRQTLKNDQLYGWVRHPSYLAMMVVILAYAVNTHSWLAGILGTLTAWFGFQYRIHHEEKALAQKFGAEYEKFRSRTGMWLPRFPYK